MPRGKAKEKLDSALKAVEEKAAAVEIEVKKATRSTGRKAKAKVEEAAAKVAEKAEDKAAAVEVEVKKATRSTGRKAKAKVDAAADKAAEKANDAAAAVEVEAKKAAGRIKRGAKEGVEAAKEAAKAPARRAKVAKLDIVIQSAMGGAITTDEIAAKVPKDAASAYVKVEENKIYWVSKTGETGSVDIW